MTDDWRLQGQERYLKGEALRWARYRPPREGWDHDHCEFCTRKFSEAPEDCHEGYQTLDGYHWVCKECHDDFKDSFGWTSVGDAESG